MKKASVAWGVAALALVVIAVLFLTHLSSPQSAAYSYPQTISLDGQTIRVAVADTDATRELGLGGRPGLASDEGMLFVFQQDTVSKFWMKDMTFSLDIIWMTADGTIVYIQPDLSPATYPNAYGPSVPARYVLEVNAGYAAAHGVKVGDIVQL